MHENGAIMSKVILEGRIIVPVSQMDAVKVELGLHIKLTKEETGCLVFRVNQREDNPLIFDVYEEFVDREAFEFHQSRVQKSEWAIATRDVKREYQVTEVS